MPIIIRAVLELVPFASLLPHSGIPYIALVLAGFAIGALGHLSGSRPLIVAGIALVFLGAFLFPLAVNLFEETPPQVQNRR